MILVFKTNTLNAQTEKAIVLILAPPDKTADDNGIISVTF